MGIILLRIGATLGDPRAQYLLGASYYSGNGVRQNYPEASKWFQKAARKGQASAQYHLGKMYAEGHGVHQDDREAFKWFEKAATRGIKEAQFNLGFMYENGIGISQELFFGTKKRPNKATGTPNSIWGSCSTPAAVRR